MLFKENNGTISKNRQLENYKMAQVRNNSIKIIQTTNPTFSDTLLPDIKVVESRKTPITIRPKKPQSNVAFMRYDQ